MISTRVDQLLKLFVPPAQSRPYATGTPPDEQPPFGTHLRQAESGGPSAPAESSPSAETPHRDSQRGRSSDVEPPADRSAEGTAPPTDHSPTVRESDETDQRDAAANDHEDTRQREPDQTADAAVAVAGDPPANTVRAEADATSADTTPNVEESLADQSVLLAENAEPPQTDGASGRVVEADNKPAETEDDAPAADRGSVVPDVTVRPTIDDSADVSDRPPPNAKSSPAIANRKQAEAQAANGVGEAAEADDAPKPEAYVARGETTAAADDVSAVDVDANEADAPENRTSDRRRGRPQRGTRSVEPEGRQSPSSRASELSGENTASATHEQERELSAAKSGPDVEDAHQRDESPTERRPQSGRSRPVAGARTLAVQNVVATSAEAALTKAGGALPADATSNPDAKRAANDTKDSLLTTFGRYDRSGPLGARGVHRTDGGQEMPHVDPARFISRVARAIHTAHERGGPLQLRLSPPELGALRLELSVKQGVLTANVETDNATTRQLLLENLPALRDRLAEQNVRIERFDVDVRRDGGEQPHFGPQHRDHGQPRHSAPPDRAANQHGVSGDDATAEATPVRRTITDTRINVIA